MYTRNQKTTKRNTTEHPGGPLKEPAQHGGLAVPVLAFHRDDIARCILVVEADAEEAIRANERPRLGSHKQRPSQRSTNPMCQLTPSTMVVIASTNEICYISLVGFKYPQEI